MTKASQHLQMAAIAAASILGNPYLTAPARASSTSEHTTYSYSAADDTMSDRIAERWADPVIREEIYKILGITAGTHLGKELLEKMIKSSNPVMRLLTIAELAKDIQSIAKVYNLLLSDHPKVRSLTNAELLQNYTEYTQSMNDDLFSLSSQYTPNKASVYIGNFELRASHYHETSPTFQVIQNDENGQIVSAQKIKSSWDFHSILGDIGVKSFFYRAAAATENDYIISGLITDDYFPAFRYTDPYKNTKTGKHLFDAITTFDGQDITFFHSGWYGSFSKEWFIKKLVESRVPLESATKRVDWYIKISESFDINTVDITKTFQKRAKAFKEENGGIDCFFSYKNDGFSINMGGYTLFAKIDKNDQVSIGLEIMTKGHAFHKQEELSPAQFMELGALVRDKETIMKQIRMKADPRIVEIFEIFGNAKPKRQSSAPSPTNIAEMRGHVRA